MRTVSPSMSWVAQGTTVASVGPSGVPHLAAVAGEGA